MKPSLNPEYPIQIEGWPGVYRQTSLLGRTGPGGDEIDRLIESAYATPEQKQKAA